MLDAGGTQSNNPRYAHFAFHAAGMKVEMLRVDTLEKGIYPGDQHIFVGRKR